MYIFVRWLHSLLDEPVEIYSEVDDNRWEKRKVERFLDGQLAYASVDHKTEKTALSLEPLPTLTEINSDPQFQAIEITRARFESIWDEATA